MSADAARAAALPFISRAAAAHPRLAPALSDLAAAAEGRLWHQVAGGVEALLKEPEMSDPALLAAFYDDFIAVHAHRLSPLAVAHFAGAAARARGSPSAAATFLRAAATSLDETRHPDAEGALLYLRALAVRADIEGGAAVDDAARDGVREVAAALDALPSPPPTVAAAVHRTAAALAKADGDASAFYRASLRHLSYVDADTLPPAERDALAIDVGTAALLADDVYSFGELLLHPIVGGVEGAGSSSATAAASPPPLWLSSILKALSDGDLPAYDAAVRTHAAALASAAPALAAAAPALRDKAATCALVALVAALPPAARGALPLADVATAAGTDVDGAEHLVMKAVARGLLRATLDGVDRVACVTWVAPRVLTRPQTAALAARLRAWRDKAEGAAGLLRGEGVTAGGLLAA